MSVLLAGVDLAAFAVALVDRCRRGSVAVSADGPAVFVAALRHDLPQDREWLYWMARLCLVSRAEDLPAFDSVFASVFDDAVLALDPTARRTGVDLPSRRGLGTAEPSRGGGAAVPWVTRSTAVVVGSESDEDARAVPDVLPSRIVARESEPFADFDAADLALIGAWFEHAAARWPRRRTRRREPHPHGRAVDLRASMNQARRTGWEPVRLVRTRPRERRRRIVLICDVSRSMRPYASTYLHLMRAAVQRPDRDAEVFAFATTVTRLTPVLAHRSAEVAVERANRAVADRYSGTHIARSLRAVLASPRGSVLRGAVVVIGSDGWDSDDPADLAAVMARLRRRANRVVWLNPRAGDPAYRPLAGAMAAALPYCDAFLPAHSIAALRDVLPALAESARVGASRE